MTETRAAYLTNRATLPHTFFVSGLPKPKQSFRMRRDGRHFTDPDIKAWQKAVALVAKLTWSGEPVKSELHVVLTFALPDNRRRDADNLAKCVLDGINDIIWRDDTQIMHLEIIKLPGMDKSECGVTVDICEYVR